MPEEKKKEGNIWRRRIFFLEEKKYREGKGWKYLEKISPKIVKDVEKSQLFRSPSRDFCQFLERFDFHFGKFVFGKKSRIWFWKIWSQKKVSVSENLVLEKKYRFRKIWSRKKVLVLVSENLVSEKSLGIGFGQHFGSLIQWLPCLDLLCVHIYFLVEVHMIKDGRLLFVKVHPAQCSVQFQQGECTPFRTL